MGVLGVLDSLKFHSYMLLQKLLHRCWEKSKGGKEGAFNNFEGQLAAVKHLTIFKADLSHLLWGKILKNISYKEQEILYLRKLH